MTTKYHFKQISNNSKTGPIPVTTTSKDSCPSTCPFIDAGCYAKSGPINIHWNKVSDERGIDAPSLFALIKSLPSRQLWRHNQAGDFPHFLGNILADFIRGLVGANRNKHGFTYTHHEPNEHNIALIREANQNGFTVNLSANNPDHAVELSKYGIPVVSVVPSTQEKKHFDYRGKKFLVCPATYREHMSCDRCQLCQKQDRKYIVAFPAHGMQKKKVDKIAVTV